MTKIMKIDGMTCRACGIEIEDTLNHLNGVMAVMQYDAKEAILETDGTTTDLELQDAIERLGYTVKDIR